MRINDIIEIWPAVFVALVGLVMLVAMALVLSDVRHNHRMRYTITSNGSHYYVETVERTADGVIAVVHDGARYEIHGNYTIVDHASAEAKQ